MTLKEMKKLISSSPSKDWFLSVEHDLNIRRENFSQKFIGIPNFFKFLRDQHVGWQENDLPTNSKLGLGKNYFAQAFTTISDFVEQRYLEEKESNLNSWANAGVRQPLIRLNDKGVLFFNSAKNKYLFVVKSYNHKIAEYTFEYLTNQLQNHSFSNKQAFEGYSLGMNFENSSYDFGTRKGLEKSSITQIKRELNNYSKNAENELTELITALRDKHDVEISLIENLRESRENEFENLVTAFETSAEEFEEKSIQRVEHLEKLYSELLKLKEPAKYWKNRAVKLKKEGRNATIGMVITLAIIALLIYIVLWVTPEGMVKSFSTSTSGAIKWSVAFIAFLSTCVFAVRVLNKLAFSSFHLARDAEEREQLCYVYLALLNEDAVGKDERQLILQSLFSRSDTGLLKEDSGPTMPTGIVSKLFGGK